MTEEKREQNNVAVCFTGLCGHVLVSDLANAAGVESMRGYLEVSLWDPKFIGEHEGEESDGMVYIIDVANMREPRGEHCRLWLSRAEARDLYGHLADVLDAEGKE